MDHKARMAAGLPYKAWKDGLEELRRENKKRIFRPGEEFIECL